MMGVILEQPGDAATNAFGGTLNAVAEGKYSTTLLGSGAAKTHLALGKELIMGGIGLVEPTALGRHSN